MQSSQQQQQARINLSELKAQLVKKLGPERSKRYFFYLNKLLNQKLSKGEFDKICSWILGRENLPLHNQLVRSILKNACHAKVPPPLHEKEVPSKYIAGVKKSPSGEDGYQQSGPSPILGPTPLIWSNGDVLPMSPRKSRFHRRTRDRPSPLGLNGKTDFPSHPSTTPDDVGVNGIAENGDLNSCDFQRPLQHLQGLAEQPDNERDSLLQRPTKRPRTKKSPDNLVPVHSKDHVEVVVVEDGEEVEREDNSNSTRSPLRAPLGIPFCPASVGGARRALPSVNSSNFAIFSDSGELFDTGMLRKRMEQIVGAQGLEGVSNDSANLLNNGLDVYLKQLIKSCIDLVGTRSVHEPVKHLVHKEQQPHGKITNGMWPGHQLQMQSSDGLVEGMQEPKTQFPISVLDFKVAMELNPPKLGEDWPLLLEKICMHACEE